MNKLAETRSEAIDRANNEILRQMNEQHARERNLPTQKSAVQNILDQGEKESGAFRMLKFKKPGIYILEGNEVPIGTAVIVHCQAWTKQWIKFVDGKKMEQRIYRVAAGEVAPERIDMPDTDKMNGPGMDPWTLQYLVPMDFENTGDRVVFIGSGAGGRRAVADLCTTWARKDAKDHGCGHPIVKLNKLGYRNQYGDQTKPQFDIIGWDTGGEVVSEVNTDNIREDLRKDMDGDDIPFDSGYSQ